ncbi:MAG: T9SS type A sorting domain-containing protein [Bacteroidia bacterium]|nr:T9SS type A sorting domain-containing protein [Bacteroidia bacterium]
MLPTGLSQAKAICFKSSSEILVGNFRFAQETENTEDAQLSFSTRVSAYNFNTNTWTHLPTIFSGTLGNKGVINVIAVHPTDNNIIYAGTSNGLYRYNSGVWSHIVQIGSIESIVFLDNNTCVISGSDLAGQYPKYPETNGKPLLMISYDAGNSIFQTGSPTLESLIPYNNGHTAICKGANNNDLFALTVSYNANVEYRFLHRLTKVGNWFNFQQLIPISPSNWIATGSGKNRIPIIFDSQNNYVWMGGQYLNCYNLNTSQLETHIKNTWPSRTSNGFIHMDIHGLNITADNRLLVANDGGIAEASLSNLSSPNSVYFNPMNYNLNVSLVRGFSGSEQHPNIYALGGQDIINTDIYDENTHRNKYTFQTWENDGGFIDKYNDNLMILDRSSYSEGQNNYYYAYENYETNPSLGALREHYKPSPNPPFQADLNNVDDGDRFYFGSSRVVQDPFRPNRIYNIGKYGGPGFYQFDLFNKVFVRKCEFVGWAQYVSDISFSPQDKNSIYVSTSNRFFPAFANDNNASDVMKFVGSDFDDVWIGHNDLPTPWKLISPNYANFSSVGSVSEGMTSNIPSADLGKVGFRKIETSPWDKNKIYVACNIDFNPNNLNYAVKVLKAVKSPTSDDYIWSNYSRGLPIDARVSTMVMDHNSNDGLYLSTDMGVYYRDATMIEWVPYKTGVPEVWHTQSEINYKENTIRVSTFGQGIWKSQIKCPATQNLNITGNIPNNVYEANYITSNGINILGTSKPTAFRGTNSIVLNPGFKYTPSGLSTEYFIGFIHGCGAGSSTSPYMFRNAESATSNYDNENELNDPSVLVYPNPTQDKFTISLNPNDELPQSISVRSVLGNEVKKINSVTERNLTIDLGDCSDGVYIVNVNYADKTLTNKIVKTSGR